MLRPMMQLRGFSIGATDGDIGGVEDFYFDDQHWTVRYLVVDTGRWLPGRRVLISPMAFRGIDWEQGRFDVALNRAKVKDSPDVTVDQPISRRSEVALARYYGFPYYWVGGPLAWGPFTNPGALTADIPPRLESDLSRVEHHDTEDDPHLRSARDTIGHTIRAEDGDIGYLDDYLLDEETWTIRYLVVETRNWWPGKKVLVSPEWIERVSADDAVIDAGVRRDAIRQAPEYDVSRAFDRDLERQLHEAHGRSAYWDRSRAA
jgi:hypothetical protein